MILFYVLAFGIIFLIGVSPTRKSYTGLQDVFPDEKFMETCKKYNTKQIASALDEICEGI